MHVTPLCALSTVQIKQFELVQAGHGGHTELTISAEQADLKASHIT